LLRFAAVVLLLVSGCGRDAAPDPELDADERVLVDLYVRLTLLEALRPDRPDSVDVELDRLSTEYDSLAVQRALARLETEPMRWEKVYETITARLTEMSQLEDRWWTLIHSDSSLARSVP
jgi:hypothetical protein